MNKNKILITAVFLIGIVGGMYGKERMAHSFQNEGNILETEESDIVLHLLSTSDIHGQVTSYDYEKQKNYTTGGLSKIAALVNQERKQYENTMLFDSGDYFYDYTTDLIEQKRPKKIQPVLMAMKLMDYDFITVGNHDFDYGHEYLLQQLKKSGLYARTLCANVTYASNQKDVFTSGKVVKKKMTAKNGSEISINVGVFGITQPEISTRAYNHTGILSAGDMEKAAKKEAAKLKDDGADIVVALVHSGAGAESTEHTDENICYALTGCEDIDVIFAGHTHELFPSSEKQTSAIYDMDHVNSPTGLVNGKALVIPSTRGQALGTVDIVLTKDKEIRSMTADTIRVKDTIASNQKVEDTFASWVKKLCRVSQSNWRVSLENKETLTNYFSVFEDNELIQMENDAKTAFAVSYIRNHFPDYKNLPIISVSKNISYGKNGTDDYVEADGEITSKTISELQKHNGYIRIYKVKGKTLREWIEWSAGMYALSGSKGSYQSKHVNQYLSAEDVYTLLNPNCYYNWKNYHIFDGIEYTFEISKPPRYNFGGSLINKCTSRVGSIYYNGRKLKDNEDVLIVCERARSAVKWLPDDNDNICEDKNLLTYDIITKYIRQFGKQETVTLAKDNNWSIHAKPGKYVVTTGLRAPEFAQGKSWFLEQIPVQSDYSYLAVTIPEAESSVNVVLAEDTTEGNAKSVTVYVQTASKKSMKSIKYLTKEIDSVTDSEWGKAKSITKAKSFTVKQNGSYTVLATNKKGDKALKTIVIDNISSSGSLVTIGKDGKLSKTRVNTKTGTTFKIGKTSGISGKVTYRSLDPSIASVSAKGLVKLKKKGKTVILIRVGGKTRKLKVVVRR